MTLLAVLIHHADLVEVAVTVTECRDPKDNKFLVTFMVFERYLVSGLTAGAVKG
jgi:predicted nucleic acid-binding protein